MDGHRRQHPTKEFCNKYVVDDNIVTVYRPILVPNRGDETKLWASVQTSDQVPSRKARLDARFESNRLGMKPYGRAVMANQRLQVGIGNGDSLSPEGSVHAGEHVNGRTWPA